MDDFRARTRLVWGDGVDRLAVAHVAIAGLGGVGCMAAESLARAGVGRFTLIDMDAYELSNINRQLYADVATLGKPKVEIAARRIKAVNPQCDTITRATRITPDNIAECMTPAPDIVIDAIDTVAAKLAMISYCDSHAISIVSCLGMGNRSDPTKVVTGDISDTAGCGCPLARVMRGELRKRGVGRLSVVYSSEPPVSALAADSPKGRHSPGSTPMVPNAAGLALGFFAANCLMSKR